MNQRMAGVAALATSAASEEYFVAAATAIQIAPNASAAGQTSASSTPI